jgi:isoprenylcysteine carboxyl methyltransferase (ICMT) family protein YpbQ
MFADTLPGDQGAPYVVAAYLVFLALLLIYLAIMGIRVARMERDLAELDDLVREQRDTPPSPEQEPERIST